MDMAVQSDVLDPGCHYFAVSSPRVRRAREGIERDSHAIMTLREPRAAPVVVIDQRRPTPTNEAFHERHRPIHRRPCRAGADDKRRRIPRWVTYVVLGLIVLVVLFFGAIFIYAKVINDSPTSSPPATSTRPCRPRQAHHGSVIPGSRRRIDDRPPGTVATGQPPVPTAAPSGAPASTGVAPEPGSSQWVATDSSQVGYRVEEVLFGVNTTAVGRTNQVDGTLSIDGTQVTGVDFTVDVASITSDESRRDSQFRGRVMSADEFPTATFALTQPIELGVDANRRRRGHHAGHRRPDAARRHQVGDVRRDGQAGQRADRRAGQHPGRVQRLRDRQSVERRRDHRRSRPGRVHPRLPTRRLSGLSSTGIRAPAPWGGR